MWEEYDITPFIVLMHTHFILYIVRILDIYEMDIPALSGKYDVLQTEVVIYRIISQASYIQYVKYSYNKRKRHKSYISDTRFYLHKLREIVDIFKRFSLW